MASGMEEEVVMIPESCIAKAVKRIAADIARDYNDLSQLVLVGVMNGGRLGAEAAGERVQVGHEQQKPQPGTHVLIVDDIVATGPANWARTPLRCPLLPQKVDVEIDYYGFKVPHSWGAMD